MLGLVQAQLVWVLLSYTPLDGGDMSLNDPDG